MKRLLALLLTMTFIACYSYAEVGFGGGAQAGMSISSFPKGVSDFYGIGFGGGAHGDLNVMKFLTVRLNADYHMFPSNKDKLKGQFNVTDQNGNPVAYDLTGLNASVFGITVNGLGKIQTGSSVTPYGLLGLGIHILNISDGKINVQGQTFDIKTGLGSQTKFGLNFGAGSEFALGAVKLFFEVKYVLVFTSDNSTSHIPIMVGVTF